MVSIVIKSFNRPHYLDRCLESIEKQVSGDFEVKVVDDGTPSKYLDLIQSKYPKLKIIRTRKYVEKSQQIERSEAVSKVIPSKDWFEAVKSSEDYVLVIEDDVWFIGSLNLDKVINEMGNLNVNLLKLGWNGMNLNNEVFNNFSSVFQTQNIDLFTLHPTLMNWMFANKFKFYSILKKLKLISENEFFRYYTFISISSGLHKKEYWLKTWENLDESVNEKKQLRNAISYYVKNKSENFIAYFNKEIIKTTFKSAATNGFHSYDVNLDVFRFNQILNEAWYKGEFDSMESYPKDFSNEYIRSFLDKEKDPVAKFENWQKWSEEFKNQYRKIGAEVE